MKKIIMILAIMMLGLAGGHISASAANEDVKYEIRDRDGNVTEVGALPSNPSTRYTYASLVLRVGYEVTFTTDDGAGFLQKKGQTINLTYKMDGRGFMTTELYRRGDGRVKKMYGSHGGTTLSYEIDKKGYYYFIVKNSSDSKKTLSDIKVYN